jgi:hypothetical protein
VIADDVGEVIERAVNRMGLDRETVMSSPFLLFGSVAQITERLQSIRERLGISHFVVREAAGFAPVVAALAGR